MQPITLPAPTAYWAPSFLIGGAAIVAGGLVAAITATDPLEHGAWVAAYLVLVVGVAQIALGLGQAWLTVVPPGREAVAAELAIYNLGNAGVIGGTLAGLTWLVDAGGILLVAALVMYLAATRRARDGWVTLTYRGLIAIVLVSIPVGLILARMGD